MAGELEEQERERLESRWLQASLAWVNVLYGQQGQDTSIAVAGVQHALGELLAVVAAVERAAGAGPYRRSRRRWQSAVWNSSSNSPATLGRWGWWSRRGSGWRSGSPVGAMRRSESHRLAIERQMQAG